MSHVLKAKAVSAYILLYISSSDKISMYEKKLFDFKFEITFAVSRNKLPRQMCLTIILKLYFSDKEIR